MDQIKLLNFADFFFNISKEELDDEYLTYGETKELEETGQLIIQEIIREKQQELQNKQEKLINQERTKLKNHYTFKTSDCKDTFDEATSPYQKEVEEKTAPTGDDLIKLLGLSRQPVHGN